jgi:dihydrolipoamide dehydrogenase
VSKTHICDVAVIGAGPGGYVAAIRAAQLGAKTIVVEREELGGVCLNWGCIPTKTLIYTAELYRKMQDAADYGLKVKGVSLDLKSLLKRKGNIIKDNKSGIRALFKANGIEVVKGDAVVEAPGKIQVGDQEVQATAIIISTGGAPAQIPGLETDKKHIITSTESLDLKKLPKRVAVIGAGAIGAEFACIWNAFGCEVTLLEMMPQVLPREDIEIANTLEHILKERGMDIRTETTVKHMEVEGDGVKVELEGKHAGTLEVDKVLVGIGRKYNSECVTSTPGLGVEVGDRGEIQVNERMETAVPGIYAVGDVVGKTLLAHGASAEGLIAAANATGGAETMDYRVVPACTFTSPEVASVGLTEAQAKEAGYDTKVGRFSFMASGRAHAMGETEGLVKIVGDSLTDEVLGVHIIGAEAGELIASAGLAMSMEATVQDIANTIHTHPTLSETLMEAAEDYLGHGIHTPPKKSRRSASRAK